jgi:hypothetical protein
MPRGRAKTGYANRTDLAAKVGGEMTYGEKQKLMDGQKDVPMGSPAMAEAPPMEATPATPTTQAPSVTAVPLTAPTQRPDENILTGVNQTRVQDPDLQKLKSLQPIFEAEALSDDAPEVFRQFVSWLRTK